MVVVVVAYWLPTGSLLVLWWWWYRIGTVVVVVAYWRCNEARPGRLRGISKEIATGNQMFKLYTFFCGRQKSDLDFFI